MGCHWSPHSAWAQGPWEAFPCIQRSLGFVEILRGWAVKMGEGPPAKDVAPLEAGKSKKKIPPWNVQEEAARPHLDFSLLRTPGLQMRGDKSLWF